MNGLIVLGVVGALGWWGYKNLTKAAEKVSARVRDAEKERKTGAQGTLIEDPETGEYRIKRDDE
jgi:membrane protein implicated in regulation of membrane protease activity